MNKAQKKAIEWVRQEIEKLEITRMSRYGSEYEFKRFEITEQDGYVFVISETGLVGDEGTMASIFARTKRHIMVGKRGRLRLLNAGKYLSGQKKIVDAKTPVRGKHVAYALTI